VWLLSASCNLMREARICWNRVIALGAGRRHVCGVSYAHVHCCNTIAQPLGVFVRVAPRAEAKRGTVMEALAPTRL
jgi:hypothetical protein